MKDRDYTPTTIAQRQPVAEAVRGSRGSHPSIDTSARMTAQCRQINAAFGGGVAQAREEPGPGGLPAPLKAGVESLSGMDMSEVRVHNNSSKPAELNALAYAKGNDIHLAPGQEQHLPHEAWHLVQQRQGRVKPTMQLAGVAINDDPSLEQEADVMGSRALQRQPAGDDATAPASLKQQTTEDDAEVVQQAPDVYAWAEYLLKGGTFEGNPHSKLLLHMKALLEEFGGPRILAALAQAEDSGQEGDDGEGDEPKAEAPKFDLGAVSAMEDLLPEPLGELAELVRGQNDVDTIHALMSSFHLPVTKRIVQAVKAYNYNTEWITFNPENFHCWMRLATGVASIRDAQYLIHEAIEIGEVLGEEEPFDPFLTEEGFSQLDEDVQKKLRRRWSGPDSDEGEVAEEGETPLYDKAHLVALEYEYIFLSLQVNKLTGLNLSYRDVAAADPDRREPSQKLMAEDGETPLDESDRYAAMQEKEVDLHPKVRGLLHLGKGTLTLADVVRGVKAARITDVATQLRSKDAGPAAGIVQRVVVKVDGEDYDTKEHTVRELMETAQRLQKANGSGDLVAQQLMQAIMDGDHKEEEALDDEGGEGAAYEPVDMSDLLDGDEDVGVEEPDVDASLLSEGEIRNINAGLADRDAKGINSDTIGSILVLARREATVPAQIAVLVWGIVNGHVFLDGNKRTGELMLRAMADKNDLNVAADPKPFLLKVADARSGYAKATFVTDVSTTILKAKS